MNSSRLPVPTVSFPPEDSVGTGHALVFAPVLPVWDEGTFFAPVIRLLHEAGWAVTVADTLAAWEPGMDSLADLALCWASLLPSFGRVDMVCGNALGGALAQALLSEVDPEASVLLVSGPARTDALLDERLNEIANLAASGRVPAAMDLLARRVIPEGQKPAAPTLTGPHTAKNRHSTTKQAGRRLSTGLRMLRGADVAATVHRHQGPLLNIVGGNSQLVGFRHTTAAEHHRVEVIADCGMRPHTEHPRAVEEIIHDFLREKGKP